VGERGGELGADFTSLELPRTTQRMQLLYTTLTQGYGWPQMMAQATTLTAALSPPRNDIPELVSEDVVPAFFGRAAEGFVWTIEAQRTAPWEKFY